MARPYLSGDLSKWDVHNVSNMSYMFAGADSFNGDLSAWDVSNVTDMTSMFAYSFFNGNISKWNVSNVVMMRDMFWLADSFNGDLTEWDVSKVTNMENMFSGAIVFNKDLGSWNVSNVRNMNGMFNATSMSLQNYDRTLNAWASLNSLQQNVQLGASGLYYCEGEDARSTLINNYGWTINDEGKNCRFQRIVFGPLKEKTYGDEDFSVDAYATSGLPIEFYSSNEEIASIDGNTVTIVGAGITNISTTQEGNENYDAADTITRELTVLKASQVIAFDSIAEKTTDDSGFIPNAEANSGLKVSFTSSNQKVSTIKEDSVIIVGVGKSQITASQAGNENYESADSVSRELLVLEGVVTAVRSIENSTVNIFPNPTHDVLHLQKLKTVNKVSVYNAEGRLLKVYRVSGTKYQIDLKDKPNGIYYIRLDDQDEVFKILKK